MFALRDKRSFSLISSASERERESCMPLARRKTQLNYLTAGAGVQDCTCSPLLYLFLLVRIVEIQTEFRIVVSRSRQVARVGCLFFNFHINYIYISQTNCVNSIYLHIYFFYALLINQAKVEGAQQRRSVCVFEIFLWVLGQRGSVSS